MEIGPGGFPLLGTVTDGLREMPGSGIAALVMLGTRASAAGCRTFLQLRERDVELVSLIAPDAHVAPSAQIGSNTIILPGAFVGAYSRLGDMVTLHGGCVVEHHSHVGHNVLMGPGVAIASSSRIGSHSFIGTGCRLIPESTVGVGAVLGAGSLVLKEVAPHMVSFGIPAVAARPIRVGDEVPTREEIDDLAAMGFA